MLEKLTWKLCNILLYNENLEMTILLSSFRRNEADRNTTTSYDCNRHLHKRINDLVRLQNIASKWFLLECYLVLTYQSKILCQKEEMAFIDALICTFRATKETE